MKIDCRELPSKVEIILKSIPETRDNDRLLVSEIWNQEIGLVYFSDFLSELERGNISHFETITRIRRRLQEKRPELRGESYEMRQHHANNYYGIMNL